MIEERVFEASKNSKRASIVLNLLSRIEISPNGHAFVWINDTTLSLLSKRTTEFIVNLENDAVHVSFRNNGAEARLFSALHFWHAVERIEEIIHGTPHLKEQFIPFVETLYLKEPTEAQINCLKSFGIEPHFALNRGDALLMIRAAITLGLHKDKESKDDTALTEPQKFFLAKHGIDIEGLDKKAAHKIISTIKDAEHRAVVDSTVALT